MRYCMFVCFYATSSYCVSPSLKLKSGHEILIYLHITIIIQCQSATVFVHFVHTLVIKRDRMDRSAQVFTLRRTEKRSSTLSRIQIQATGFTFHQISSQPASNSLNFLLHMFQWVVEIKNSLGICKAVEVVFWVC